VSPRTLEVSLPDDFAAEVKSAVQRGEYASESGAVLGAVAEWRVEVVRYVHVRRRLKGLA
jgi:Arc/MetJ-type ribon-helix-helix transcriptional regulator